MKKVKLPPIPLRETEKSNNQKQLGNICMQHKLLNQGTHNLLSILAQQEFFVTVFKLNILKVFKNFCNTRPQLEAQIF